MTGRAWFAIWFLALGWDLLLPHIDARAPRAGGLAILAGLALLVRRATPDAASDLPGRIVLVAGTAVAGALLPWPFGLGPLLIAAGTLAGLAFRAGPVAGATRALRLGGAAVTLQALASVAWRLVEGSGHDVDVAAPFVAGLLRLAGSGAAADGPFVHFQGTGRLLTIDCTWERLAGYAAPMFFVTGGVLAAFTVPREARARHLGILAAVAAAYVAVRAVGMALLLDDGPAPSIYWTRPWVFATLLPAAALLAWKLRPGRARGPAEGEGSPPAGRRSGLAVAAVAFGLLVAASFGFHDPGRAKTGRVVIDEKHSNWEWSTIALDTDSYGTQTVYNYSELVRFLQHYYDVDRNLGTIDDDLLRDVSVLILKTPTAPYDEEEVDAVVRFVERGGGLWLVGDHTNVFGMSTNLNQVARRFGMSYVFDAVIDLKTNGRQLYRRPPLFAHPVVRHLPPLHMATSSSMTGPFLGRAVMLGGSLLSDRLDYSVNSFFGDFQPDASEPFGSMLQSVALERGRGRVLGFSDSTIFSNFFMFIRGKPELALASVGWLARENAFPGLRPVLLLATGIAGALAAFLAGRRSPARAVPFAASLALAGFAAGARGLDAWTSRMSALPEPERPLPLVAFERGRTDWHIPDFSELPENSPQSYHTFYVWTQRVGLVPMSHLYERCLERARSLVLINPRIPFTAAETGRLAEWVHGGGRVLVMDTPHARSSSANALLQPFGLRFEGAEVESVAVHDVASGDTVAVFHHAAPVVGGDAVLALPDGSPVLAVATYGQGRVVAMNASDNFSDAVLGTTSQVPDPAQLALYRLEFRIFRDLVAPEVAATPPQSPAGGVAPGG